MRRKAPTTKTIRANHWEPHECVVIRGLNTDDDEFINDGVAGIDAGQPCVYAGRQRRLTLQRGIVSWTLTDEHSKPLPLNEQSIRGLASEDSQYIFNEILKLNTPISESEKKDSSTPSTPGAEVAPTSHHSHL